MPYSGMCRTAIGRGLTLGELVLFFVVVVVVPSMETEIGCALQEEKALNTNRSMHSLEGESGKEETMDVLQYINLAKSFGSMSF